MQLVCMVGTLLERTCAMLLTARVPTEHCKVAMDYALWATRGLRSVPQCGIHPSGLRSGFEVQQHKPVCTALSKDSSLCANGKG